VSTDYPVCVPILCLHRESTVMTRLMVRTAEPLVILDTLQDWRFAKNPNVLGPPHIRFYAGAPLRTSDGFNLGSLCIIDDKPRQEFTPRSRLILKEFAAVTMREMELWRDKVSKPAYFADYSFNSEFVIVYKRRWRSSLGNAWKWKSRIKVPKDLPRWSMSTLEPHNSFALPSTWADVSSWISVNSNAWKATVKRCTEQIHTLLKRLRPCWREKRLSSL
jgi:hypothetical protein